MVNLELSDKEIKILTDTTKLISEILMKQCDKGVVEPTIECNVNIKGESKKVKFMISVTNE